MNCKEFTSLIDSYMQGNLSENEEKQEAFERHFFECDLCFAQLKAVERLYSKEIPITVKIGSREAKPLSGFSWADKWKPALAFASVLVLVLTAVLVSIIDHSNRLKLLYRISDFPPPGYIQGETRDPGTDGVFTEAMGHYNRKEYSRALKILKEIQDPVQNPQVIFFKGICFLLTDQLKESIKEFDLIIEDMNPSYYDEAIYYKATALLRLDKKEKALEQLNHLAGMFSPYAPRARALINKINNL